MAEKRVQRRLAAILAADVVGYSRLMEQDEAGTLARLKILRSELFDPKTKQYGGRIFKNTGDGALAEFGSAVDAVQSAVEIQRALMEPKEGQPEDQRIILRIGISLGDVIVDGEDLYGNGVNVAARMESLAEPGAICVSGNVHEHLVNTLDLTFEDLGEQAIKNIDRRVRCYRVHLEANAATDVRPRRPDSPGPVGDKPSIAVLPFANLSNDPDQEYFADGLTEDLITALSYWGTFSVIARNSTFAYKGLSPDVRDVAKHLGVAYVLEGSVRKAGDRVRVTVQLIEGASGKHVWAERFDRKLDDFFELQDEITQIIAAKVEPEFAKAEQKRAAQKHSTNLDAWECYQRGVASLNELTKEGNIRAREYFTRAIQLDPTGCRAYSGMGYALFRYSYDGYSGEHGLANEESVDFAKRAVALDDGDAEAHEILALSLLHSGHPEAATAEARRAIELNPNLAHAYLPFGNSQNFAGNPQDGIPYLETAIRLNPDDIRAYMYLAIVAEAHLNNRDYQKAEEWARRSIDRKREFANAYCTLASALGHQGRIDEAAAALAECLHLQPGFIEKHPSLEWYKNPADKDHILDGLRKAGWER